MACLKVFKENKLKLLRFKRTTKQFKSESFQFDKGMSGPNVSYFRLEFNLIFVLLVYYFMKANALRFTFEWTKEMSESFSANAQFHNVFWVMKCFMRRNLPFLNNSSAYPWCSISVHVQCPYHVECNYGWHRTWCDFFQFGSFIEFHDDV